MTEHDDALDSFLQLAFSGGVQEPQHREADASEPVEVPADLIRQTIKKAGSRTAILLARRILRAAGHHGFGKESLAREAAGYEKIATRFLTTGGDPSRLPPRALARMLWRAQLSPVRCRQMIEQAIIPFALASSDSPPEVVFGRSSGLSERDRTFALTTHLSADRDPVDARRSAERYVREVEREWTILKDGDTTNA